MSKMRREGVSVFWNSHKNYFSNGFCQLQQNEEFTDMTLAAEGRFLKVHRNMLALASPYLKALIESASCQHPMIFLTRVSHQTLCYILDYVYTGEVRIPTENLSAFIETCKELSIHGLQNMSLQQETKEIPAIHNQKVYQQSYTSEENNKSVKTPVSITSENKCNSPKTKDIDMENLDDVTQIKSQNIIDLPNIDLPVENNSNASVESDNFSTQCKESTIAKTSINNINDNTECLETTETCNPENYDIKQFNINLDVIDLPVENNSNASVESDNFSTQCKESTIAKTSINNINDNTECLETTEICNPEKYDIKQFNINLDVIDLPVQNNSNASVESDNFFTQCKESTIAKTSINNINDNTECLETTETCNPEKYDIRQFNINLDVGASTCASASLISINPESSNFEVIENNFNVITKAQEMSTVASQIMIKGQNYNFSSTESNLNVISVENNISTAAALITINPETYNFDNINTNLDSINIHTDQPTAQFTLNPQNDNLDHIENSAVGETEDQVAAFAQINVAPQCYNFEVIPLDNNLNAPKPKDTTASAETTKNPHNYDYQLEYLNSIQKLSESPQSCPVASDDANIGCGTDSNTKQNVTQTDIAKLKALQHQYEVIKNKKSRKQSKYDRKDMKPKTIRDIEVAPHFVITSRGTLQLLSNRFLYNCHHYTQVGLKRRWRCIDYRKFHCPAVIDTCGDDIVTRNDVHSHNEHNNKVLTIIKKNYLFKSLAETISKLNKIKTKESAR